MKHKLDFFTSAIRWSFYILFFCLPLLMFPTTSELFEFNKMWFVFIISLFIFFLWTSKCIIEKKIQIVRTPLDIPILLFLLSQFLSTIFSIEPHVSWWGYYSRFNGGFLSTLCYIFLYYAFASNIWQSSQETFHKYFGSIDKKFFFIGISIVGFCFLYILWLGPAISGGFQKKEDIIPFNSFVIITSLISSIPFFIKSLRFPPTHKAIFISLLSGTIVSLWGFPSHYGFDPTCFAFRAALDVSCWTDAFQPKVRIFSTLGQPNWLAAHLSILLPIAIVLGLIYLKPIVKIKNGNYSFKIFFLPSLFFFIALLFYLDITWTGSQSGFFGFWVGCMVLIIGLIITSFSSLKLRYISYLGLFLLFLGMISFFLGTPIGKLNEYTWPSLSKKSVTLQQNNSKPTPPPKTEPEKSVGPALEYNITASGNIRKIVWEGAFKIFQQYPLFGSGVETFAYAYYKARPVEHNLTSEWDYLYNKAHNEYLNYLATTGAFGLGTYLLMIGWFLWTAGKYLLGTKSNLQSSEKELNSKSSIVNSHSFLLSIALLAAYFSILVSNFFGFSVVTINFFFFMIPIFFYSLVMPDSLHVKTLNFKKTSSPSSSLSSQPESIFAITILGIIILYLEILLIMFWQADIYYALGNNVDKAGRADLGTEPLEKAVSLRAGEDTFRDELSVNYSTIALYFLQNKQATQAADYMRRAKELSDEVILNHPNNIPFLKSRTRVLYTAAQFNKNFLPEAIKTLEYASSLAPTDAKISYNIALLYEQAGRMDDAIKTMEKTIELKPNYRDARYGLATYYSQKSKDLEKTDIMQEEEYRKKAITQLDYILQNISPNDPQAKELLKSLQ